MSKLYIMTAVDHGLFRDDPDEDDVLWAGEVFASPEAAANFVDLTLMEENDELNEDCEEGEQTDAPVPEWTESASPAGRKTWTAYVEEIDCTFMIRETDNPLDL